MTTRPDPDAEFDESLLGPVENRDEGARLSLSLDGYEGPLDLLLDLARRNKLDLRGISILALADQYLDYIREARRLKLEVAGDYLVMAAWLTLLKSKLMLPKIVAAEEIGEAADLAQALADRLSKLERIRKLGAMLASRLEETQRSATRGASEAIIIERRNRWLVHLHDLVAAYADMRQAQQKTQYRIGRRISIPIPEARAYLDEALGEATEWTSLDILLATMQVARRAPRSAKASAFAASLELVRDGRADIRQEAVFAPLYLKRARRLESAQTGSAP
jgi:segregation and condensation protein A